MTFSLESSIKSCEQAFTRSLARDGALCAKGIRAGSNACADATIGISNQNASLLVHGRVDEVEKIAIISAGGAAKTD
jgi:hypothetical protein